MMAAAEARAAWQRTANRCFVQEDAKRAPKLACCSSKLQSDSCNGDTGNRLDDSSENSMPLNLNPTNSNLPPDTQWWLHLQPNFENQRDFTYKRLNTLKSELDDVGNGDLNPISTVHEEPMDSYLAFESQSTSMKHDSGSRLPDPKAVKIQHLVNHEIDTGENLKVDYGEYWFKYNDSMDWKSVDLLISDRLKKVSTDSTTPCVGVERTGPWWHTADKDELASLVAQKSLEHIENCDLPPPQKMHVGGGPFTDFECFDPEANTSLDRKICPSFCNPVERATNFPDGGSASGKESGSSDLCRSLHDSEKLIRIPEHWDKMNSCVCRQGILELGLWQDCEHFHVKQNIVVSSHPIGEQKFVCGHHTFDICAGADKRIRKSSFVICAMQKQHVQEDDNFQSPTTTSVPKDLTSVLENMHFNIKMGKTRVTLFASKFHDKNKARHKHNSKVGFERSQAHIIIPSGVTIERYKGIQHLECP